MADVDIFVGNNTLIDPDVYQLWLSGYTDVESSSILQKRGILQQYGATFDCLLSDTQDHYRTLDMLEPMLQNPTCLPNQLTFQITLERQRLLIESYYEFDAVVLRELSGKKLTSRLRNSLDDVSEKTKIPLRSCRRQFDNVKQVLKIVEDLPGPLVENIQANFVLSNHLAEQYAALVFMGSHRFETSKKRSFYLTLEDLIYCARELMQNWTCKYKVPDGGSHQESELELDRDFLLALRDLKPLTDGKNMDEHKIEMQSELNGRLSPAASADIEGNFRNLSKALVNIACGLSDRKELRDFFLDLIEKLIDPCRQSGWSLGDVRSFLTVYTHTAAKSEFIAKSGSLSEVWPRYMKTITGCVLRMYHA